MKNSTGYIAYVSSPKENVTIRALEIWNDLEKAKGGNWGDAILNITLEPKQKGSLSAGDIDSCLDVKLQNYRVGYYPVHIILERMHE